MIRTPTIDVPVRPPRSGERSGALGPRPFRTVLLPAALSVGVFAAWFAAVDRRDDASAGALVAALAFAFVTMIVVLAFVERRPDLVAWFAVIAAASVAIDVMQQTTEVQVVALVGVAILWHVALREPCPSAPGPGPWTGSVALLAAGCALVASGIMLIARLSALGALPVGFGLAFIGVVAVWPALGPVLERASGQLWWVLVIALAVVPGTAAFGAFSPQPIAVGAIAALAATALLVGPWLLRAVAIAALGAELVVFVDSAYRPVVVLAITVGVVATGLAEPALARLRALGGAAGERWLRGAPLLAWLAAAVAIFQAVPRVDGRAFSVPDLGPNVVWVALPTEYVVVLSAVAVLALAVPWPRFVVNIARARPFVLAFRRAIAWLWRSAVSAADAGDLVVGRLSRALRRVAGPLMDPTRPPESAERSRRQGVAGWLGDYARPVALWFVANAVVKNLAANASTAGGRWPTRFAFYGLLDLRSEGRVGWGTGDYWAIADHGYRMSEHREAFLPLLPILLRWVHASTGLTLVEAQVLVASISGLAATVVLWAWMRRRAVPSRTRLLATVLFIVFPWNFLLFGYGYADATVVALVLGAFLLAEYDRPILAGLVGSLAAIARPNGVPIIAALLLFELVRSGALRRPADGHGWGIARLPHGMIELDLRKMRLRQWGVLLSVVGLLAFSLWMWHHAGNPLYWLSLEEYYGHEPITQLVAWTESLFTAWPTGDITGRGESLNQIVTAAVVVGSLLMLPAVRRRFGAAYGFFAGVTWAVAWTGSRVFTPSGRLLMPITPFLAVIAAQWLHRRPRLAAVVVAVSAIGSLGLVVLFTRGGDLWLGW